MRLLVYFILLYFSSTGKAEMISKCAVNGTLMDFQCSDASWWYVDGQLNHTAVDNFSTEARLSRSENITDGGFQIIDITCFSSVSDNFYSADLMVAVGKQVPLNVTAIPVSKTSLLLEWGDPLIPIYFNYTVTVTLGQEEGVIYDIFQPALLLNLEGLECEPFEVTISMPGNCEAITVEGSLLVEPPYPLPQEMTTISLENKSVVLTWQQPDNIFGEANFAYNITARSLTTGHILEQRVVVLGSLQSPWEKFNFSKVEVCEEVQFTLSQVEDCREQYTTTYIPIFPGEFVSELEVEVFFRGSGDVGIVEFKFQPPALCEYQLYRASYVISVSDGISSWLIGPDRLTLTVVVYEAELFVRDKHYIATATVITDQGNATSKLHFSTLSPLREEMLDQESLIYEIDDTSDVSINWSNPTYSFCPSFVYVVSAQLVATGEIVAEETVVVARNSAPSVVFSLSQYICQKVNITVRVFNRLNNTISKIIAPPARPTVFQQNMTAYPFMIDGKIKELEVSFTPPRLCDFQGSSYVMRFTSGNESWSRDAVIISDTSKEIKEDIETGFVLNKNYTVAVTVIMDHGNITSSADFSFLYENVSTIATDVTQGTEPVAVADSGVLHQNETTTASEKTSEGLLPVDVGVVGGVGAAVAVTVLCMSAVGIGLCYLKQKKTRADSEKKVRPTVTNPIYETGDDVYEELPDANYDKVSGAYSDVAPPLPSARYDHLPAIDDKPALMKGSPVKQDPDKVATLTIPVSKSIGALSNLSGEDCYQIMNPVGTLTMMPRSRDSGMVNGGPQ